jgi:hypothetical protein
MNKLKVKFIISITVLFFLLYIQLITQTTYYVSSSGNDTNDDSSSNTWVTIQGTNEKFLPMTKNLVLKVYDIFGNEITTLVD